MIGADLHNQARQFHLALEKKWVAQNGYFRLYTTMLGVVVVDTWKAFKIGEADPLSVREFSDILAKELTEEA